MLGRPHTCSWEIQGDHNARFLCDIYDLKNVGIYLKKKSFCESKSCAGQIWLDLKTLPEIHSERKQINRCQGLRERRWGVTANGYGEPILGVMKIFQNSRIHGGDGCTTLCMYLMPPNCAF